MNVTNKAWDSQAERVNPVFNFTEKDASEMR